MPGRMPDSALVFHPDDPLFARFRHSVETEQGTMARRLKGRSQAAFAGWSGDDRAEREQGGIVPLESNALALRYGLLRPGSGVCAAPSRARGRASGADGRAVRAGAAAAAALGRDGGPAGRRGRRGDASVEGTGAVSSLQRHPEAPHRGQAAGADEAP